MNVKIPYYYFKEAFTSDFCDKVLTKVSVLNKNKAVVHSFNKSKKTKKDLKNLLKLRDSDVIFLSEKWIYDEIVPHIKTANKEAGWNFDFDWCESAQFTIYGKQQHYDWHQDSSPEPYNEASDINHRGKIRKISCSILLNDSKEFKGGEFQFDFRDVVNKDNSNVVIAKELQKKGSMIVFPSYTWHKVNPVTKGTRYSLVVWFIGKPFK